MPELKTPVQKVVSAFGGVRATARAVKRDPARVTRWGKPIEEGGSGGRLPTSVQTHLMQMIQEGRLNLTAADLVEGA